MQTVRERLGSFEGLKMAFVGDGNNVAQSLMLTSLRLGMDFALACPPGYLPNPDIVAQAEGMAAVSGASLNITHDLAAAVHGAHAIYTDVWASMGQEQEAIERRRAFRDYQVNDATMGMACPDAIFLHCLPAKRGEEVTDSVMESPQSAVFDQAENRLHAQKALLLMMLA
jgi:ornithine carbamoyltransferase